MTAPRLTTPGPLRTTVPPEVAANLRAELQALVQHVATQVVDDEDASGCARIADGPHRGLMTAIAVAAEMAQQAALIQRTLWALADECGVSRSAVARARGVRPQAQSKVQRR